MPKFNKNQYTLKQVYAHYLATTTNPVSFEQHKLILDTWGKCVNKYLLAGHDVKLHKGLSIIGVRKKIKRTFINRKECKKQKTLVKSSNIHAGFYGASVYWRRHYTSFNSRGWAFIPTRELNRALGKVMLTPLGHTNFIQQAIATSNKEQAKASYNKKILKL